MKLPLNLFPFPEKKLKTERPISAWKGTRLTQITHDIFVIFGCRTYILLENKKKS
jgi:hypothetical protein